MKVIVGLGNPGREYEHTRHNVGWWVVDHLADVWHFDRWRRDGQALATSGRRLDRTVRLIKPQTYMNLSGAAVVPYLGRPDWSPSSELLVVVDDVALPVGKVRLRPRGSAGGHNGLKSIERSLGTREYARLRIGIRPAEPERSIDELADFVLSPFSKNERATVLALFPRLTDAIELWLGEGIEKAMNAHN